ncbi:hypothetical protein B0H16DRAFT_105355 [Mycena metata]|uniref:Uncharacterized protein n=1 Tax=Mycena metata TaxID=1033252 RepID=A0AAD7MXP9_9AGAR|nr:hypothetical protein B0H16DRAFT_105355 [Mycena metata]
MLPSSQSAVIPSNPGTSLDTKIVIYQALIALLEGTCTTSNGSPGEVPNLQPTLEAHRLSMTSGSVVGAIMDSLKNRKILLEVASQLGLKDFIVRAALRADEEHLVALLVSALESKPIENSILTLEDDSAQCFIDVVQDVRIFLLSTCLRI